MKLSEKDRARKEDFDRAFARARVEVEAAIAAYNSVARHARDFAREKYDEMESYVATKDDDDWNDTAEGQAFWRWAIPWERAGGTEQLSEPDFGDIDEWIALSLDP